MYDMTTAAMQSTALMQAPKLRLLPEAGSPGEHARAAARPQLRAMSGPAPIDKPVLLAGDDTMACAAMRRDLAATMPASTQFVAAGTVWEMLAQAADASMVFLGGEVEDVPAETLMQMLAQRHPGLPVVSVDAHADALSAYA